MKANKAGLLVKALNTGKYRVDCAIGCMYYYHKATDSWRLKQATLLPTGYKQHTLFLGRGKGKGFVIYEHHVIWLYNSGEIPKGREIDHIDSNPSNNRLDNLRVVTKLVNIRRSKPRAILKQNDRIRHDDIITIYKLWLEGNSQRKIGLITGINRLTVRYHIKKMEKKEPFKYSDLF